MTDAYDSGWHNYLNGLNPVPPSASSYTTTYDVSPMVLAASEDKTYRGAYIASPTMPWVWGTGLESPSGAYHLVWARDLYEIATALIADGDPRRSRPSPQLSLQPPAEIRRVFPAEFHG